ncbi:undecaprenyldiphospho-muramoylpentapeptide beta-N-acetylglucosaminyltransferase [Pediococcus cellicola]|uniref:UDP-N-acetylglucosamine--N-acetylmuramyl-(pentapeptide) pyrophosphoryl-undecaprenol N-acetylglucosamine transferase n=1 Tax=Pediococcus cellicola TaxID=319652 RepID=A0A0R2IJW4_9LACO|nr:undecaprenyldiphospho-muramoylpentapeptide beta-N-acetylglucosaminyltransferase [Pediococcus cellicola]KRN65328.1 udp-n-acetylglucosamine--n-acetylmuramyl-(pentapeptide) pyrophosphoryl-undecaprenol n-acetylglucosamine transferase [Pediococcus cellicola]GEL15762.1 UDP-N-acetylglucosamine--N-acetylmuramyl-(pentapeptide) pyrophosphoryl-undecaprenol N-acetylglucosamine transferase [Pediococcus cellicola]
MRLMISGGGTGGHIYPALALIEALKEKNPDSEVLYVGTEKGLESRIVPDQGIAFKTIRIQGFKRSLSLQNFKTIGLFIKSVADAHKMIKDFHPDVVVGTGGYVSGAVVFAASLQGIPTVIHEQNSVVGVTNKFLSYFVTKIGISFEDARAQFPAKKVVFTGNPRATQVASMKPNDALSKYGLKPDQPTLLIFGGSRGAERINSATVAALPELKKRDYQVLFVTGRVHFQKISDDLRGQEIGQNIVIRPYIKQMPELLPNFQAILGRAGATSIAEITALGIPSILVPSPYVTNDHQTKNAKSLVNNGAAELLTEADLTGASLLEKVDALMTDGKKRQKMSVAAKAMGRPRAAFDLLNVLQTVIKK